MAATNSDIIIIGGGIVGLSTAYNLLLSNPGMKVLILEKEEEVAAHQTGHNSGVIHSGIYYKPGSLKAQTCVRGSQMLIAFCEEHDIPYERCGKGVVATSESELPRLEELYRVAGGYLCRHQRNGGLLVRVLRRDRVAG